MFRLDGKVALVTGGSRGIGAAIARRLADDGAAVAITYSASNQSADEIVRSIRADGGKAIAIRADAADVAAVKHAVARTVEELGGLDIVVNNAGVAVMNDIAHFSDDDFERMLSINVRSVFYTVREAARHLRDGGRVILIGWPVDLGPFSGIQATPWRDSLVGNLLFDGRLGIQVKPGVTAQFVAGRAPPQ